jgi:hypothetical protein
MAAACRDSRLRVKIFQIVIYFPKSVDSTHRLTEHGPVE